MVDIPIPYHATVAAFLEGDDDAWLTAMATAHRLRERRAPARTQQDAWRDCRAVLLPALRTLCQRLPSAIDWWLIFEYALPREARRPDLVILAPSTVGVVEFKQAQGVQAADVDQVAGYGRDLSAYHPGCRMGTQNALVVTRRTSVQTHQDGVALLGRQELADWLATLAGDGAIPEPQPWLAADFRPRPGLVQAARRLFADEPLPTLRQSDGSRVAELVTHIQAITQQARQRGERHLVLVSGAPGTGKTLVGLRLVHEGLATDGERDSVYLSGNDPLVAVLRHALGSRVFVQPVRGFYYHYGHHPQRTPPESLIVFDEAQRAWDAERMTDKYGLEQGAPEAILGIADRIPGGCVVVALLGEGQQIHVGEEGGNPLWQTALDRTATPWHLHCDPWLNDELTAAQVATREVDSLFQLTAALRSHRVNQLPRWVEALLAGDLSQAADLMATLRQQGFSARLTRDLAVARDYCQQRYGTLPDRRFGLIASSRARNLERHGVPNGYLATRKLNVGAWYNEPPDSPRSGCQLERAVTEFGCQGLELDLPLVAWGNDLRWADGAWHSHTRQRQAHDPARLRRNSYRVLLTRGREGLLVFVPPEPAMDTTAVALRAAGLLCLTADDEFSIPSSI